MGANDRGHFSGYEELYENCLANGKTVVVCTVGTQDSSYLKECDIEDFADEKLQSFNRKLTDWAGEQNVRVIDLYSFTRDNITVDPADGIHYLPRPTNAIWNHILAELSLLFSAEPRTCCVATAQNTWLAGMPPIGEADSAWRHALQFSALAVR